MPPCGVESSLGLHSEAGLSLRGRLLPKLLDLRFPFAVRLSPRPISTGEARAGAAAAEEMVVARTA